MWRSIRIDIDRFFILPVILDYKIARNAIGNAFPTTEILAKMPIRYYTLRKRVCSVGNRPLSAVKRNFVRYGGATGVGHTDAYFAYFKIR